MTQNIPSRCRAGSERRRRNRVSSLQNRSESRVSALKTKLYYSTASSENQPFQPVFRALSGSLSNRCGASSPPAPRLRFVRALQRKRHRFVIQFFQDRDQSRKRFSFVVPVRAQNAGKAFLAIERDPRKLSAVVVQKSGRQAHAAFRRDVGACRVVVGTVEIIDPARCDQTVLNGAQRRGRSAACPDSTVGEGLAIRGNDAQKNRDNVRKEVNDWLSGLGC